MVVVVCVRNKNNYLSAAFVFYVKMTNLTLTLTLTQTLSQTLSQTLTQTLILTLTLTPIFVYD